MHTRRIGTCITEGRARFGSAGRKPARARGRRTVWPRRYAGAIPATGAIPVGYSCNLAAYGPTLAPLNIPAALSAESTGLTVTVTLVTQPVQVPAVAASALPQLSYLDIVGTASANGMSGTGVNLSGQSGYLGTTPGSTTQLPAMTATGTGTVSQAGTGPAAVEVPQTLMLTPVGSASPAQQAPLTCTTSSATTVQVTVATGTQTSTPGQAYTCTVAVGTSPTAGTRTAMTTCAGIRARAARPVRRLDAAGCSRGDGAGQPGAGYRRGVRRLPGAVRIRPHPNGRRHYGPVHGADNAAPGGG